MLLNQLPTEPASPDTLDLRVRINPGIPVVVEIDGEIDIASAPCLRETLLRILRCQGPAICVDLRGVTFLDCSGVNVLLGTARRAQLEGGWMRLICASACAWRIITLLGLKDLLTRSDERVPGSI